MNRDDPAWREHLDIITAWGEVSAVNGTPAATDDQLWSISRRREDLNLPEHIDPELLAQLREAFHTGRFPGRIDLRALADALRRRGHDAVVEHTGGGVVVLYAGRVAPDRYGDPRWSAAFGPGWYAHRDLHYPVADPADCYVGPDGDGVWALTVPAGWTIDTLAELTAAVIDEVEASRARFARAAEAARDAMWATFAAQYPEITAADVAVEPDRGFVAESDKVLAGWLEDNRPNGPQPSAHLIALAAGTASGDAPSADADADADAAGREDAR